MKRRGFLKSMLCAAVAPSAMVGSSASAATVGGYSLTADDIRRAVEILRSNEVDRPDHYVAFVHPNWRRLLVAEPPANRFRIDPGQLYWFPSEGPPRL